MRGGGDRVAALHAEETRCKGQLKRTGGPSLWSLCQRHGDGTPNMAFVLRGGIGEKAVALGHRVSVSPGDPEGLVSAYPSRTSWELKALSGKSSALQACVVLLQHPLPHVGYFNNQFKLLKALENSLTWI